MMIRSQMLQVVQILFSLLLSQLFLVNSFFRSRFKLLSLRFITALFVDGLYGLSI